MTTEYITLASTFWFSAIDCMDFELLMFCIQYIVSSAKQNQNENWSLLFEVCNHINHFTSQFTCALASNIYFHSQTSQTQKAHQSIAFLTKQSICVAKLLLLLLVLLYCSVSLTLAVSQFPHASSVVVVVGVLILNLAEPKIRKTI